MALSASSTASQEINRDRDDGQRRLAAHPQAGRACQPDFVDRRRDQGHRRADQPPGAQRGDRGGARRRAGARLRRGRRRGAQARRADVLGDHRDRADDFRHSGRHRARRRRHGRGIAAGRGRRARRRKGAAASLRQIKDGAGSTSCAFAKWPPRPRNRAKRAPVSRSASSRSRRWSRKPPRRCSRRRKRGGDGADLERTSSLISRFRC
jgi:hypothetical protein